MSVGIVVAGVFFCLTYVAVLSGHMMAEVVNVEMCAYLILAAADSLHLFGIITNFFAGIMFRQYGDSADGADPGDLVEFGVINQEYESPADKLEFGFRAKMIRRSPILCMQS